MPLRTLSIRPGDAVLLITNIELFEGDVDIGFTVTNCDASNIFCYRKRISQKDFESVEAELNCHKYRNLRSINHNQWFNKSVDMIFYQR